MMQRVQQQPSQARPSLTKTPSHEKNSIPQTSFSDHIAELRRRVFFVLLVFLVASSLAYNYRDALLGIIMNPLSGEKLIYLTPGGGFNFIFQIALYAGLLAAAPMFIYQLYGFIRPALPKKAQRSSLIVVLVAFLLMLCGVGFGYFVAVPSALHFLNTFAGDSVTPSLTADSYLSFFLAYIAGLGVLFELPLLLLFLHWIHPMTPGKLLKSERFVILFAFVAAALITPTPDMLNQAMIAVPLILIYQLGAIAVLVAIHRDRRKLRQQKKLQPAPLVITAAPKPLQKTSQSVRVPTPAVPLVQPKRTVDGFSRGPGSVVRPRTQLVTPPRNQVIPPPRTVAPPSVRRTLSVDGFPIN